MCFQCMLLEGGFVLIPLPGKGSKSRLFFNRNGNSKILSSISHSYTCGSYVNQILESIHTNTLYLIPSYNTTLHYTLQTQS